MTIADKLLELNDVKQDIKTAIENKGVDLTDVDFGGYAEKIDEIPAVVELTQAQYDELSQGETWVINESPIIYNETNINENINFIHYSEEIETNGTNIRIYFEDMFGVISANTNQYIFKGAWFGAQPLIRTLTFETAPTGDLLVWLEANAVKQIDEGYDDNTYYLIVEE